MKWWPWSYFHAVMAVTACLWKPVLNCCLCCHALVHCLYTMLSCWLNCCTWPMLCMNYLCFAWNLPPPVPTRHTHRHPWPFLLFHHNNACFLGCFLHISLQPDQALRVTLMEIALGKVVVFCTRILSTHVFFCNVFCRQKVIVTWRDLLTCFIIRVCSMLHIITPFQTTEPGRWIYWFFFFYLTALTVQVLTCLAANSEDIRRRPITWQRGRSF